MTPASPGTTSTSPRAAAATAATPTPWSASSDSPAFRSSASYNGCGTAGSAILTCTQAIEAGAAEVALAVGFDKHARGPFDSTAAEYGLPDWYAQDGMMVTTQFFALKTQRYLHDHGLDARLLGEIAAKALRNGSITPHAWRRKPMSVDEIMTRRWSTIR